MMKSLTLLVYCHWSH